MTIDSNSPTGLTRRVDRTMAALGFVKQNRHWVHPGNPYWVGFPAALSRSKGK